MQNRNVPVVPPVLRLHLPHTGLWIGGSAKPSKPFNQCTRIQCAIVSERKKELYPHNAESSHAWGVLIFNNESTIVSRSLSLPQRCGADAFTAHSPNARIITRGIECGY